MSGDPVTLQQPALTARLRSLALCETEHPADAASALIEAAVAILCVRWPPEQVIELLVLGIEDATDTIRVRAD